MEKYKDDWNEKIAEPLEKKLTQQKKAITLTEIFPYKDELSNDIDFGEYCKSFLIQPKLFLRLRPEKQKIVTQKLQTAKIPFAIAGTTLELNNNTKLEDIIKADEEAVVQDLNSQKVLQYLEDDIAAFTPKSQYQHMYPKVWDCCAASGGKSILAYDVLKHKLQLTVSDVRLNILQNLHTRFRKAGIKHYEYFLADLTQPNIQFPEQLISHPTTFELSPNPIDDKETLPGQTIKNQFDIIICDAPCTGSGTWSRTPEQLLFFKKESINLFAIKQKQIAANTIPFLKKGGTYIYITCSVFKKENEEVVEFIKTKFKLKIMQQLLLAGYDKRADNMFVAIFKK